MTVLSAKSVLSSGFRFHNGQMVPTVSGGSGQAGGSSEGSPGGSNSKTYIFEGILSAQSRGSGSGSSRRGSGMSQLTGGSNNSHVWETGQFWEDIFCGEWKIIMAEFSGQTVTIAREMFAWFRLAQQVSNILIFTICQVKHKVVWGSILNDMNLPFNA